jgi:hypothetical protein
MTVWDGKTIICASKWMNVVEKFRILLDDYDRTGLKTHGFVDLGTTLSGL